MAFKFVPTTEEIRDKMFDFLKPEYRHHHDLNVYNINWKYGVYDKESGIFLTLIYYVSDFIARCGKDFYSYIVITDKGDTFKVDNNNSREGWEFSIPEDYSYLSHKVKEGIKFYENHFDFTKSLSEETKKEFKRIEEIMYDRCCKNFPINCEDDAKKLFKSNDFNENRIYEVYNKKTVENFNKYATVENISCWRQEEYNKILTELFEYYSKHRDEKDYNYKQTKMYFTDNFNKINRLVMFGIKNINMELLCDVVKTIDDNTPFFHFTVWQVFNMQRYAEYYLGKNPDGKQNIMPLMNWVEERRLDTFLYTDLKKLLDKYDS